MMHCPNCHEEVLAQDLTRCEKSGEWPDRAVGYTSRCSKCKVCVPDMEWQPDEFWEWKAKADSDDIPF